jgi:Fe-S-cluster containining protein
MNRSEADALLKSIYDRISASGFQCQGKCQDYCGPVPFSNLEWQAVPNNSKHRRYSPMEAYEKLRKRERDHHDGKPANRDLDCDFLGAMGQCTIYENRPFICRLFGATPHKLMQCGYGCKATLTKQQQQELENDFNRLFRAGF